MQQQSSRSSVFAAVPSPSRQTIPTSSVSDFMSSRTSARALPPSQSYAVLVKIVLRKRLRHMHTIVGLASYLLLLFVVFDPTALPGGARSH